MKQADAKTPAVAVLARGLLGVSSAIALKLSPEGNASFIQKDTTSCSEWVCSDGYLLKEGAVRLHGLSDEECCDMSCQLHHCGEGYSSNQAYWGNLAVNDQLCCDVNCGADFATCDLYWLANPEKENKAGQSSAECCTPSCHLYSCPDGWDPVPGAELIAGSDTITCCQPTCSVFECSYGWVKNNETLGVVATTDEECCVTQCMAFEVNCSSGFRVKLERRCELGNTTDMCCEMLCEHVACGHYWANNESKHGEFGSTPEECCSPTCHQFECDPAKGWTYPAENRSLIHTYDAETCCEPNCKQHTCSDGWATDESADDATIASNETCCVETCALYQCGLATVKRPEINDTIGYNETVCCENEVCKTIRDEMKPSLNGCHDHGEADCEDHYYGFVNGHGEQAYTVCTFDERYKLCRIMGDDELVGCSEIHGL